MVTTQIGGDARTSLLTYYFPGDRSLATFAAFVLPDLDGAVVVHDRYQNYGIDVLAALRDALAGDPWMPPLPP